MYQETIGIVGGFGGLATTDFFRRVLQTFFTGMERDYPRIVLDCDFTMPSRTRGLLYDEEVEQITEMISISIEKLIVAGADKIVLPCGTAHWYLDGVYKLLPVAKEYVVDMIEITGERFRNDGVEICFAIAAEGALKKQLYEKRFEKYNVKVVQPKECDWPKIRYFIEAVKQNKITPTVKQEFKEFILQQTCNISNLPGESIRVILGCTELPLLVDEGVDGIVFEDPLENVLNYLKEILE